MCYVIVVYSKSVVWVTSPLVAFYRSCGCPEEPLDWSLIWAAPEGQRLSTADVFPSGFLNIRLG